MPPRKKVRDPGDALAGALTGALTEARIDPNVAEARICTEAIAGKALRVLWRPGTQTEGTGWLCTCENHGTFLLCSTRRLAERQLTSAAWCEACQTPPMKRAPLVKRAVKRAR